MARAPLFGRLQRIAAAIWPKAPPPRERDAWAPDDLAECVIDGPWYNAAGIIVPDPKRGQVMIVDQVAICPDVAGNVRQWLIFRRWPTAMFAAEGFRKLTPRADAAQAADAAFLDRIRRAPTPGDTTAPAVPDRIAAALRPIAHRARRSYP